MARGLIVGLVMGVVALVIAVMVGYVIVSNMATVESDLATAGHSQVVVNETGYINNATDAYQVATANVTGFSSPVLMALFNATQGTIPLANASISSTGVITNATAVQYLTPVYITYTYKYKGTTDTVTAMTSNFTKGVDNVSKKLPTILLIAAVVLILGVLVFLWAQYKRMGIGSEAGGL